MRLAPAVRSIPKRAIALSAGSPCSIAATRLANRSSLQAALRGPLSFEGLKPQVPSVSGL
jgi:hypothetical protein